MVHKPKHDWFCHRPGVEPPCQVGVPTCHLRCLNYNQTVFQHLSSTGKKTKNLSTGSIYIREIMGVFSNWGYHSPLAYMGLSGSSRRRRMRKRVRCAQLGFTRRKRMWKNQEHMSQHHMVIVHISI